MAKTFEQLKQAAGVIKNEVEEGANSANRIGAMFQDTVDYVKDQEKLTLNVSSKGQNTIGIYKRFIAVEGRKYKIILNKIWDYTPPNSWMSIFDYGYFVGEAEHSIKSFRVLKEKEFVFTAPANTNGYVFFRASTSQEIQITIIDVTDIPDLTNIKNDIATLKGNVTDINQNIESVNAKVLTNERCSFSFEAKGKNSTGINKQFIVSEGRKYKIVLNKVWAFTPQDSWMSIFDYGYYVGDTIYSIKSFRVLKEKEFVFTAPACDCAYVFFRAGTEQTVQATVTDITDIEQNAKVLQDSVQNSLMSIEAKGGGVAGVCRQFVAIKGHHYKICVQKIWNYTEQADWQPIIEIGYFDMQGIKHAGPAHLNGSVRPEYIYRMPDEGMGYIFFRAAPSQTVRFTITDIEDSFINSIASFNAITKGNGYDGAKKYFLGIKGHRYRLTLPKLWAKVVTNDQQNLGIYSVKGDTEYGEYGVIGTRELQSDNEFTINHDNDYCYIFFRAPMGESVQFILQDITEVKKSVSDMPFYHSALPYVLPWQNQKIRIDLQKETVSTDKGQLALVFENRKETMVPEFNISYHPTYENGTPYETTVGYLVYIRRRNVVMVLGLSAFYQEPTSVLLAVLVIKGKKVWANPASGLAVEFVGNEEVIDCFLEDIRRVDANRRRLMPGEAKAEKYFCILHASDMHNCSTAIMTGKAVRAIKPDVFINTGDTVFARGEEYINNIEAGYKEIGPDIPKLMAIGNHDVWWKNEAQHPNLQQVYDKFTKPFTSIDKVSPANSTYYFYDDTRTKIRIFILNVYDKKNVWGGETGSNWCFYLSDAQISWFRDSLASTPDGWAVIVCAHQPVVDYDIDVNNKFTSGSYVRPGLTPTEKKNACFAIFDLLEAFKNHTKGQTKANGGINAQITFDFTAKKKTDVICYLSGHYHFDFVANPKGYSTKIISVDCTLWDAVCSDLVRNFGVDKSDSRNEVVINALIIDRDNRRILLSRVGCKEGANCYRDFTSIKY